MKLTSIFGALALAVFGSQALAADPPSIKTKDLTISGAVSTTSPVPDWTTYTSHYSPNITNINSYPAAAMFGGFTPGGYTVRGQTSGAVVALDTPATDQAPLCVTGSTVTISIASPGVVSWTSHGRTANQPVLFSTTGALPTGLSPWVTYFVSATGLTADAFSVSATPGGATISTTGSQSGTHTAYDCVSGNINAAFQGVGRTASSVKGVAGLYGGGYVNGEGGKAWGINAVATNFGYPNGTNPGFNDFQSVGGEFDVYLNDPSSGTSDGKAVGVLIYGSAKELAPGGGLYGIEIGGVSHGSASATFGWNAALAIDNAENTQAISIGTYGTAADAASQQIQFKSRISSVITSAYIRQDASGFLNLRADGGLSITRGSYLMSKFDGTGLSLLPDAAGNSQPSKKLTLEATDSGGSAKTATLTATATGTLNIKSDTDFAFISNSTTVASMSGNGTFSTPRLRDTSTAPTLSSCGTSPSINAASFNSGGKFTTGTGTPTACTVTFSSSGWPAQAWCSVTPANAAAKAISGGYYISAQSATAFTLTLGTGTDSAAFQYVCSGN